MSAPLPFDAPPDHFEKLAKELLAAHRTGDPAALRVFHESHPRFLDDAVPWLPKPIPDDEIAAATLDLDDARLAVARSFSYRDWAALVEHTSAIQRPGPTRAFEAAADAVLDGDVASLEQMLAADAQLVHARSVRVTCHDPAVHGGTLLHYLAANGIEGYRQRTAANAVDVARLLLTEGAEVDALAGFYGGDCTTMSLLVSSSPPADAGVQVPLVHLLLDHGAAIEGYGTTPWKSPLMTALVFGFLDVADALAARGANADHLAAAAGLGHVGDAARLLPAADADARHLALALAAQLGHHEVVRLLLDAGEDPDRYNPAGCHSHGTPLHHAALAGHDGVVRLLVDRGARLDIRDTIWQSTPLGWAEHGGRSGTADLLRAAGG